MVPGRVAGGEGGRLRVCDETDTMVAGVSHDDNTSRGDHCDSTRGVEACGCASAVGECAVAAACKRCNDAEGRHEADAVVTCVGHHDHAARRNHSNTFWVLEARGCTHAVGKGSTTTSRKRCNDTLGDCHKPDPVVVLVGHDDHAARGDHCDSTWEVEGCRRASSIAEGVVGVACERCDDAEGRHEADAVVPRVGHNDHATRGDHSDSVWIVESCGGARAVCKAAVASRER